MTTLNEQLASLKVIPVIAINKVEDAIPLGKALVDNGMPCAEITFRTECAADAIAAMRQAYPEMLIGAGTVLTNEQVDQAIEAGVDFIVSQVSTHAQFNTASTKTYQSYRVLITQA